MPRRILLVPTRTRVRLACPAKVTRRATRRHISREWHAYRVLLLRWAPDAASTRSVSGFRAPLFAALVFCLSGCATTQSTALTARRYEENAKAAFTAAMAEFEEKDWESATHRFEQVKREFAYSRYARLAELRLADIVFKQEKFPEAVTAYRTFVHDHPNDKGIEYARFQVTKALFEQTGDSVMLPAQEERELASAADAYAAMKSFLTDFPTYEGVPEIEYMLSVVTGLLVRHELYVARFYLDRGRFEAATARCRYALDRYEGSGLEAEALVLLGETYLKMKKREEARETFASVLARYPESAFTVPARNFLAEIEHPANGRPSTP
ncbi:MAG TPA: outer membrane protein assembly factor BamD [Polyangiaceae bacterium]|nr:outer membrane protein assembly factor BamD [Polyangiaceae bacterium]